jgi:Leucine-rich repeat (LRR) protein
LKGLDCSSNKLNKLNLNENVELVYLFCSDNELTNLSLNNNNQLNHLECSDNKLSDLDLTKNNQLSRVYCHSNQLTRLDLNNNKKITSFYCFANQLTSLGFLFELNPQELKQLSVDNNKFFPNNLNCFSKFVNLEVLGIGKNAFLGSLEPLKNLSKLK